MPNDKCPPDNWTSWSDLLEGLVGEFFNARIGLHKTMRDHGGERFESASHLEAQIRHADWVFAEPIDRYIAEVVAKPGVSPKLDQYPEGALPLLEARVDAASSWVHEHSIYKRRDVLPFPTAPVENLFSWLLGPWWEAHGRRFAAWNLIGDALYDESWQAELMGRKWKLLRPRKSRRKGIKLEAVDKPKSKDRPDSWAGLANWFEKGASAFQWFPEIYELFEGAGVAFINMELVRLQLKHFVEPEMEELEGALAGWINRGTWPERMDAVMGAVIATRLKTVAAWARTHIVPTEGNPIDFPAISFRRLLRWLLRDWWNAHGSVHAAEAMQVRWVERRAALKYAR